MSKRALTRHPQPNDRGPSSPGGAVTASPTPVINPSGPFALAEHRHPAAIGMDAVDIDFGRADHPVDMDQALIAALCHDLRRRQLGAVDEAFRIALAKRDVGRGVLVE